MTIRCSPQPSSLRDLLAVVTSFSLLSLFLTYHLGFPAGRIPSVNSVAMRSQLSDIAQDIDYRESPFRSSKLLNILRELEKRQIWPRQRIAVLRGRVDALSRHAFQMYNRVLHNLYFELKNSTSPEDAAEAKLLLCLSQSDGDPDCWSRWQLQQLKPYQRVNRVPGIWSILWWRAGLCRTVSRLQSLPTLAAQPLSPLCYPLPEQYEDFLNTADGPGFNLSWILKPSSGGTNLQHLSTMQIFNRVRLKEFPEGQEGLVQQFVPNQLHVLGFPVSVQLFVLVTSIAPLRAYLFREGIVHFRRGEDHGYKKVPGKWWLLSQLWRHVGASQGAAAMRLALDHTDSLLVHLLLGAEAFLLVQLAGLPPLEQPDSRTGERIRYRCEQCYQLLAVELMYNTSLYPFVMSINGQPIENGDVRSSTNPASTGSESLVTRSQESLLQTLVTDSLELQFATDSVHRSVFKLLQKAEEKQNTGVTGLQCLISHDLCLTEEDLSSLLLSRREMLHTGGFRRLYPSESGSRYTTFLQDLQSFTLQDTRSEFQPANHLLRETLRHSTADLHGVQTRLEQVLRKEQGSREEYFLVQDSDIEPGQEGDDDEAEGEEYAYPAEARPPISLSLQSVQSRRHNPKGENCSQDESLVTYLKTLDLQPMVALDPPFTPLWTEYRAVVQYDVTMVRITAVPMHCRVQARYEHHQGPTGSLNTTLGLGSNRIVVLVQDVASSTTINTYLLTLTRHAASHSEPRFDPSNSYAVCGLRQECEYQIAPKEPCGLQQETPPSLAAWTNTLTVLRHLPSCPAGDAFGRWLVPCSSCSDRNTCVWSQLRWQPYSCSHRLVPRDQLATCLLNKTLLFIGDSTNRGMMHYIMEQLNGSLAACDKTHHIRVYSNLNQGQTTLSFAYYPQFWLTAPDRPVFDKTLYQLLLKSQPLQNTSDTVVIVGGVHWLATQHLHTLLRVLRREGLQGAHLVVKTLGSGFHIPAEGVHYLPKEQRERLLMHSMGLAAFARHHHMDVVDTLNMTAARYKDFLQGKCACHFHKLEARGDFGSGYRVEGPINALYTEILLSRLCGVEHDDTV